MTDVNPFLIHLGCIYKLTSRTERKTYIGQVALYKFKDGKPYQYGLKGRWSDHVSDAPIKTKPIAAAIVARGPQDFSIEILEIASLYELNDLEIEYIERLHTIVPFGYNVQRGGSCAHRSQPRSVHRTMIEIPRTPEIETFYREYLAYLRYDLANKYVDRLRTLEGLNLTKIRIATAKNTSAKRQDGHSIKYETITVYVHTDQMRMAKDALKFRFGGVNQSVRDAYSEAIEFVAHIPRTENLIILNQVNVTVENR